MTDDNLNDLLAPDNKWKFVFKFGVLFWGVMTAVLVHLLMYFTGNTENSSMPSLAISLLIFPVAGFFWGLLMWHFMVKFSVKATQQKNR